MLYRLFQQPQGSADAIATELSRLAQHVGRLPITMIHVGPPLKRPAQHAIVIEVPDDLQDLFEQRILPIIMGPEVQGVQEVDPIQLRPEWTLQAQLRPTADAQALDYTAFAEWTSVCLTLEWMPGACRGILRYSADDVDRLEQIRSRGWIVSPRHKYFLHVWVGSTATSLQPTLGPVAAEATHDQASVPDRASAVPSTVPLQAAPPIMVPQGSMFAEDGAPGLLIGTTPDGTSVRLAWRAQQLAVIAPIARQRMVAHAFVDRAFHSGMAVIAVVPRAVAEEGTFASWSTRIRVLDGFNQWQSAALPWRSIPRPALGDALGRVGITRSLPDTLPEDFGELLQRLDAAKFCTEPVLGLTALPGDDLPGVVAARGGVMLLVDDHQDSDLLAALLLAVFTAPAAAQGPILLIRPPQLTVPQELMNQTVQLVVGSSSSAMATLHAESEGWRLVPADGSPPIGLAADLLALPATLDDTTHTTILDTLGGAAAASSPADDRSTFASPVADRAFDPFRIDDLGSGGDDDRPLDLVFDEPDGGLSLGSSGGDPHALEDDNDRPLDLVFDEPDDGLALNSETDAFEPAARAESDGEFSWGSLNDALDESLVTEGLDTGQSMPDSFAVDGEEPAVAEGGPGTNANLQLDLGATPGQIAGGGVITDWTLDDPILSTEHADPADQQDGWSLSLDDWTLDPHPAPSLNMQTASPQADEMLIENRTLDTGSDDVPVERPADAHAVDLLHGLDELPLDAGMDDDQPVHSTDTELVTDDDESAGGTTHRTRRLVVLRKLPERGRSQRVKRTSRATLNTTVEPDHQDDGTTQPVTPTPDVVVPASDGVTSGSMDTGQGWGWLLDEPLLDLGSTPVAPSSGDDRSMFLDEVFTLSGAEHADLVPATLIGAGNAGFSADDMDVVLGGGLLDMLDTPLGGHDQGGDQRDQGGELLSPFDSPPDDLGWTLDLQQDEPGASLDMHSLPAAIENHDQARDEAPNLVVFDEPAQDGAVDPGVSSVPDHALSDPALVEDDPLDGGWGFGLDEEYTFSLAAPSTSFMLPPTAEASTPSNVTLAIANEPDDAMPPAEQHLLGALATPEMDRESPDLALPCLADNGSRTIWADSGGPRAAAYEQPLITDEGASVAEYEQPLITGEGASVAEYEQPLITDEASVIVAEPVPGLAAAESQQPVAPATMVRPVAPMMSLIMPSQAQEPSSQSQPIRLDGATIWAAWQEGADFAMIVRTCAAAYQHVDQAALRKVVRELLATLRQTNGPPTGLRMIFEAEVPGSAFPVLQSPAAAEVPTPAESLPSSDQPALTATSDDDAIWAAWSSDKELSEMVFALCGFYRGVQADATKQRIHRIVIPRIVADLKAEAIVDRLLTNRKLLQTQGELYETLLRRLNRQTYNVTGIVRDRTENRLRSVMRAVRDSEAVVV